MQVVLAIVIGVLFAGGVYMLLRRSMVKLIIGLALLSQAANLLVFTIGKINRSSPPLIAEEAKALTASYADPIPQALILTAIVIGFGAQAFAIVLIRRIYEIYGSDDVDGLRTTEH